MRLYNLTKTTNKGFKHLEEFNCTFTYSGGGAIIQFKNDLIETSRVLNINVHDSSRNIRIETKNSEYYLERV